MEIPPALRAWFVVHFLVDVAVAIPLLLVPEEILPRVGWSAIDSVSPRLVAAALMAIGVQSWRCRNAGIETYRTLLGVKILWSATAIAGLTIAIARGAPPLTFGLLSIFLGFSGVWSHYAIRLRQQAQADAPDAQGLPSEMDDQSPPPHDGGRDTNQD
jgi:hypothetical protein